MLNKKMIYKKILWTILNREWQFQYRSKSMLLI